MPRMKKGVEHPKYEARRRGDLTYMKPDSWSACGVCGTREAYVSNGRCVFCARMSPHATTGRRLSGVAGMPPAERKQNKENRKEALLNGSPVYERSRECQVCLEHNVISYARYTKNGGCVECQKRRSRETHAKMKSAVPDANGPIIAAASTCKHGAMLRLVIPELNGKTLRYVRHWWGSEMLGEAPHYGKCVLCHPSRLVSLRNKMVREGGMPDNMNTEANWIMRLWMPTPEWPRGLIVQCQAEKNMGVSVAPAPQVTDKERLLSAPVDISGLRFPGVN